MPCIRQQQKHIQKYKTSLECGVLFLFGKQYENTGKGNCRITGNTPLDHVLSDQTSKIFFVVNPVIKQRYIVLCLETVRSKHRKDHRKQDHRSDQYCDHGIYRKNTKPFPDIFDGSVRKQIKVAENRIKYHKDPQHIKEIKV